MSVPVNRCRTEPVEQQLRGAKNLTELFAILEKNSEPEDHYDLLQALNENRKGERPLFTDELKGVTW